ncbi:MAG: hypothetical protein HUN05_19270 [Desulfobacter sp.]|nr:MAG: hypothetical protein HUN05_19270 [Desulfobacter sp.]
MIIARLVGVKEKERVVPPRVDYYPSMGVRHGLYGYYGASYHSVYQPGYTVTDTIVNLETTLFCVDTQKLVWSGMTSSQNPSSDQKIAKEAVALVIAEMKTAGLL